MKVKAFISFCFFSESCVKNRDRVYYISVSSIQNALTTVQGGMSVKKCVRNGNMLAFSLGMLAASILPPWWIAVVAAVLLTITTFVCGRCRRC